MAQNSLQKQGESHRSWERFIRRIQCAVCFGLFPQGQFLKNSIINHDAISVHKPYYLGQVVQEICGIQVHVSIKGCFVSFLNYSIKQYLY